MNFYEIVLIGIALAMDASAITIANCTTYKNINRTREMYMLILFSLFQGIMPLIGYFTGKLFYRFISPLSDYFSALIFLFLSLKIIYDKIMEEKKSNHIFNHENNFDQKDLTFFMVLLQAVATSIDALAVGITLTDIKINILFAVSTISFVTLLLIFISLLFGKKLGKEFNKSAPYIGSGILFLLFIKSLLHAIF